MRRKIAMIALLGGLAAGLGCQHIAGKSDCGFHPSNYVIGPATPPYPSNPVGGVIEVTPPMPIPKSTDKDEKDKEKSKDMKDMKDKDGKTKN